MTNRIKRGVSFRPSATEAKLEERLVLSSSTTVIPAPAPTPFFSSVLIGNPIHARTVGQFRSAHARQVALATVSGRSSVALEIARSDHSAPSATVTQLSRRASLVAASGMRFVPTTPSALLAGSLTSVASALSSDFGSSASPVPSVTPSPGLTTISLGSTGTAGGVAWQSR
jgi:hypothetical protein